MKPYWLFGLFILVGFMVHYVIRRAVAAMFCLAGAAFTYLGIAPVYQDRGLSLATGLGFFIIGLTIFRCNYLWLKNSKTILAIFHADGVKAAIQAQLRYLANEFIPRKANIIEPPHSSK